MIKNSTLIVVEDSGHIPMWETPDKVNSILFSFLKEN
jgi:pimeloyl-ACP methyl ester carboxylesterase